MTPSAPPRPFARPLPAAPALALALALAVLGALAPAGARAQGGLVVERLQVTDPFLEMHTGPGRGYPVFHVVPRDEWVQIELRYTDWYKVRTEGGKVGWVPRVQLASTLTEGGTRKTFRDLTVDDYLKRRAGMGIGWGRFKGEPMVKLWGAYRLSETLGVEATAGQVQGVFSGTDFWHVDLTAEPWSDQRWSPFFAVGLGKFRNIPNASLVDAQTNNANLAHAGIGVRWYFSERFVARLDWSIYTAFVADTRSTEYRALTAGISFFF
jgi:hypothetical protein